MMALCFAADRWLCWEREREHEPQAWLPLTMLPDGEQEAEVGEAEFRWRGRW